MAVVLFDAARCCTTAKCAPENCGTGLCVSMRNGTMNYAKKPDGSKLTGQTYTAWDADKVCAVRHR